MDPISHAVFGYAVVTAVRWPERGTDGTSGKQSSEIAGTVRPGEAESVNGASRIGTAWRPGESAVQRGVAAASMLGALAPDVDALFMPIGWDVYLRVHEVGTHSMLGTLPVALAVAWVVRATGAARLFSRVATKPFATPTVLFVAAWLGALSHLALDVVSGARTKVAWPLLDARTHVPLVAMAEPWLAGLFVIGILTLVLARERRRAAAIALLTAVAAVLTVKSLWLFEAVRTLDPVDTAHVERQVIEARWATLREWSVFRRTDATLQHIVIQPGRAPMLLATVSTGPAGPTTAESPVVARSRSLDTVQNFLAVHELPFAREAANERGETDVLWSDIRFCRPAAARPDPNAGPPTWSVAMSTSDRDRLLMACGLWFGGTYDRMGRALRQWVRVGSWLQTRPAGP